VGNASFKSTAYKDMPQTFMEKEPQGVSEQGEEENMWGQKRMEKITLPHNFYFSPNIVRVNKSKRLIGRTCSTHADETCIKTFVGNPEQKIHFEHLGVPTKIILKWMFKQ
jgi:hypothetical protein